MPPGQQVIEDYRHLHLSLKAHPVSFLRADLDARGIVAPRAACPTFASGRRVTIAGLVLVRQRPGIGNAIFMTLEDETAIANTIVWPRMFERFRPIVLGARLISVTGVAAEREGRDPHRRRAVRGSDAAAASPVGGCQPHRHHRADRRGQAAGAGLRRRHPRDGDALVTMLKDKRAVEELAVAEHTAQVMPKGRNFH